MYIIAVHLGRTYFATTLSGSGLIADPLPAVLFPCLIWDHDGLLPAASRSAVARTLLDAGCRYLVCGGKNCEAWHDAMDWEFVAAHVDDPSDAADSAHVMTSWHEGETPDQVALFFVLNTNFDYHDFRSLVVIHVGTGGDEERLDAAVRRHAFGDRFV